jgi:diguanylate cyclase (GGDEF)-like protein
MTKTLPAAQAQFRLSIEDGIALGAAVLISAVCVRLGWFDHVCMMMRRGEVYEIDEYVGAGFVLLAVTVIMFIRREWQLRTRLTLLSAREQSSHEAARRDHLTGLANRLALMERMNEVSEQDVLFLLIDLDGFKAVNDQHGHAAGDSVLKVVSQRLQDLSDKAQGLFVARLGGDEFGCLLLCSSEQEALAVQQQIVRALEMPVCLAATKVSVGASVGSAASADGRLTPDELLQLADTAMYQEKVQRSALKQRVMELVVSCDQMTHRASRAATYRERKILNWLCDQRALSLPLRGSNDFDGLLKQLDGADAAVA